MGDSIEYWRSPEFEPGSEASVPTRVGLTSSKKEIRLSVCIREDLSKHWVDSSPISSRLASKEYSD